MKKSIFWLMAAACILAGCNRAAKFTVEGDLASAGLLSPADSVQVTNDAMERPITVPVTDGNFRLSGKVENPELSRISVLGASKRSSRFFIAEKGTIRFQDGHACGTPLNDEVAAFTNRLKTLSEQYSGEERKEKLNREFTDFVSAHSDDPCAAYAILIGFNRLDPEVLQQLIDSTAPAIRNQGEIRSVSRRLKLSK